jgi:hypothetical protein
VRSGIFPGHSLLTAVAALAFGAMVACAPPAKEPAAPSSSSATLTSGEVNDAPPAAREAQPTANDSKPAPASGPGQLVCRTTNSNDGTTELFLEWSGTSAKGLLRRTAPSGMVHEQNVRAERYKGAIVADDVNSTDLVVHAATVAEHNGKQHIRLGEAGGGWVRCD